MDFFEKSRAGVNIMYQQNLPDIHYSPQIALTDTPKALQIASNVNTCKLA